MKNKNNLVKYKSHTLSEMYKLKEYIESTGYFVVNVQVSGSNPKPTRNLLTYWAPDDTTCENTFLSNTSVLKCDQFDLEYYLYHL